MKIKKLRISRKWMIFSVTANGTFMSTLSAGIVNIALPSMAGTFSVSLESIQLVVSVYLLVLTCFLPVFGKLSDIYSRKWMYLSGFITFGAGALIGALSSNLPFMLLARSIQGLGSSAMMATSQALIAQVFHGKSRGQAFGAIGAVVAIGSLAGPALGGVLIQAWGWQSVFWVCLPVCVLGVWRGLYLIPRFKNYHHTVKMDYIAAALFTLTGFTFLYALNMGAVRGWSSKEILSAFMLSVIFFLFFIRKEKKSAHPFIGLSIFRIPAILYGCIVAVLGFAALFANSVLLPFYLTDIMNLDPIRIGMLILPFPICLAISSAGCGILCTKWPTKIITTGGLLLILVSNLMFAFIGNEPTILYIILAQMIMGAGSGIFQVPNNNTVISAAPKEKLGVVASVNALARNAGMIGGIALSVAIFTLMQSFYLQKDFSAFDAFIQAYKWAMFFGGGCALAGGIVSAMRAK